MTWLRWHLRPLCRELVWFRHFRHYHVDVCHRWRWHFGPHRR